jgi:hypothetical protein
MRRLLHNPEAYLDEAGIAHVNIREQQEGIGGPRVSRMSEILGISREQAEQLRDEMREDRPIRDILRHAAKMCGGKPEPVYYPSRHDTEENSDGILFVDLGDPRRETIFFDYRDGRFVLNAWGPSVARQADRFAKSNPRRAARCDRPEFDVYLTYVDASRRRKITAGFASEAAAKRALREVREVMQNYPDLAVPLRLLRRDDLLAVGVDPANSRNWDTSGR